jgi:hypothetical protein
MAQGAHDPEVSSHKAHVDISGPGQFALYIPRDWPGSELTAVIWGKVEQPTRRVGIWGEVKEIWGSPPTYSVKGKPFLSFFGSDRVSIGKNLRGRVQARQR